MKREEFEKKRERWAARKEKGKTKFIIQYGVLYWGTIIPVIITVLRLLFDGDISLEAIENAFVSWQFVIRVVLFMAGGIVFGLLLWKSNSAKYD